MEIRIAKKEDYEKIYQLVKTGFETAKVSDGTEQDFVYELRKRETYIPELELVAEENNTLIGHIMFTKQVVKTKQEDYIGLLVAPLCVKLEERGKRVGEKLMRAGFEKAKELGYTAAFLIGDSNYYKKFGYQQTGKFGIKNIAEVPDQYVLGCEIIKNSLENIEGTIDIK